MGIPEDLFPNKIKKEREKEGSSSTNGKSGIMRRTHLRMLNPGGGG